MNDQSDIFEFKTQASPEEALNIIGRLFDVAKPESVFNAPVELGAYTVITASELLVTMGAGFGSGGESPSINVEDEHINNQGSSNKSTLGGGGGGGVSMGRPVAAITVGPGGVQVNPIFDPTKILIAFFTTFTAMIIALSQIWRSK